MAIVKREETFKRKFRGIPAYKVAMAMTRLQHGIDFHGCSKALLAESWGDCSMYAHEKLKSITLDQIHAKILELYGDGTRLLR